MRKFNMFYGFLSVIFFCASALMTLIILFQKGKGSMGLGAMGGGQQQLFGGSGGQDLFQKITWILGFGLMAGSFALAYYRTHHYHASNFSSFKAPVTRQAPAQPASGNTAQ